MLADTHYISPGFEQCSSVKCFRKKGLELIGRAIRDAAQNDGFDVVVLLGDLIDNGTESCAKSALQEIRDLLQTLCPKIPLLVVPGNHDGEPQLVLDIFDVQLGGIEIGGYRFVLFADGYYPGDVCTRSDSARKEFHHIAAQPGGPVIALQHNPIYPNITGDYPYMLTNCSDVIRDYTQGNVLLSLSGHYHAGQPCSKTGGVNYVTIPSLVDKPFRYATITLRGRNFEIYNHQLDDIAASSR